MYYAMLVLLMAALPIVSIIIEWTVVPGLDLVMLVGKWFVFWAAGVRLLLAGLRQASNPAFTARTIFDIEEPKAGAIVRELGFGNIAMGVVGMASVLRQDWVAPMAIVTGLYYGLAGALHVARPARNRIETWAMVSDLWVFLVLALFVILRLAAGH